ncbi:MAG: phage integrase central domain-containing protein [Trebonia sp.]
MAYTQARKTKTKGTRHVGYYLDGPGEPKVAGTFDTDDEALRVAQAQEDHVRERRSGTPPADKATMTIEEFDEKQFLPRIDITPKSKQTYKSHLKNHVYPYLGRERIAEITREQLYTHLVTTLPEAGATLVTRRAVRTVLSSMLQMAWDETYRHDNPVMTIKLRDRLGAAGQRLGQAPAVVRPGDPRDLPEDQQHRHHRPDCQGYLVGLADPRGGRIQVRHRRERGAERGQHTRGGVDKRLADRVPRGGHRRGDGAGGR